ncbi:MAG TPA: translocation/assembly module TamB domain-containing protein [Thermoanaerobaculia bacterium]|nr:translocation/assembly module TamB domain-containing protein [Thermoanaerobaculia bacterium]
MSKPDAQRRKTWRRGLLWLAGLAAALALLVLGGLAALRSQGVRRALLARVGTAASQQGLHLTASDFELDLRARRIAVDDLAVAAAGSADRPFLTVERVVATLEARSVARRPLRILELDATAAWIDLGAPLPARAGEPEAAAGLPVTVERLRLLGLTIVGAPVDAMAALPLESWALEALELTGSLQDDGFELTIERGDLVLTAPAPATGLRAQVSGRVSGALAGPFTLHHLELAGDGIAATASGTIGLAPGDPLRLAFDLDAEPGRLAPEAVGSRLRARGDLDLRTLTGTVDVAVVAVPATLLEPFVTTDLFARFGAAGTLLDAEADLRLDGRDRVAGTATLTWRESVEGEPSDAPILLVVDAATVEGAAMVLDLAAELLPSWSGERTATARVRIPAWNDVAAAELVSSRLNLIAPDLRQALRDLERRFPRLLPPLPPTAPLDGALSVWAQGRGPIADPELELRGEWRPGPPGSVVEVRASGHPLATADSSRRMTLRADFTDLDLAALEALRDRLAAGVVSGTVELDIAGESLQGRARIDGRDLAIDPEHRVDSLVVELTGSPRAVSIERLEAVAGDARVVASGTLALDFEADRPLRGVEVAATLERPVDGVSWVEATLRVDSGTAHLEVSEARTDFGAARARLDVPLGALAGVPALADAIASLPTPLANGPVEIAVIAPDVDGAALLRRLGGAGSGALSAGLELALRLDPARPGAGDGTLTLRRLLAVEGDARVEALDAIVLRLEEGRLTVEPFGLTVGGERLRLAGGIDLSTEWRPGDDVAELVGTLRLDAEAPSLDVSALAAALGWEAPFESLRATGVSIAFAVDPAEPAAAQGELALATLEVGLPEAHWLRLAEPTAIRLVDRRLRVAPTRIEIDGQHLTLEADARLEPDWRRDRPLTELIASLEASLAGVLQADALEPYLGGAAASGRIAVEIDLAGTGGALTGHARLQPAEGGVEITLFDPYFTRLRDPRVELRLEQGAVTITAATAELNEGRLRLAGGGSLTEGTIDVTASLQDVRYRLDYGVTTLGDAELRLTRTAGEPPRLAGRIVLDSGLLRRDLDADREILRFLFAPEPAETAGVLDELELDLELATVDGLRIRNNLADLRATWAPLSITGTLAEPRIEGAVDLDPGGYLHVYGQTVRIDSGRFELRGELAPEIELETTASFEDPTVARSLRGGAFAELVRPTPGADDPVELERMIGGGLAGYYGERLASRLSEGIGAIDVSLRPILVFGLDKPGTELTVSRDVSAYVTAAVSVSLREEGRQTYVAEVHEIDSLPRFLGQIYTLTERSGGGADRSGTSEGVILQQRLRFGAGGGQPAAQGGPRLRRIVLDAPAGVLGRRAARRAVGYERGDRLGGGVVFETEIEVAEALRRRGYPGARVRVTLAEAGEERADLRIAVDPGPEVAFEFRGRELHRSQEDRIASIYRPDFYESISLAEMREQTVRELRGAGYLDPVVEVTVTSAADAEPLSRTVLVVASGGERMRLEAPRFTGIDDDAAAAIALRFPSAILRAELLDAEENAEHRLRTALAEQGYPGAAVVARELERSEDAAPSAARPVIALAPAGPRQRIAEVRMVMAGTEGAGTRGGTSRQQTSTAGGGGRADASLADLPALDELGAGAAPAPGDPIRSDHIARGALAIQDELYRRGHTRARVRPRLIAAPAAEHERILLYEVERAGRYAVGEVTVAGLGSTRAVWAAQVAGLEAGAPLEPAAVRAARRRLFETGLFRSVVPEIDWEHAGDARVSFLVAENPRFEVAYGVLWQSGLGSSAVLDAVDSNAFGRGITLGARARYRGDDSSGRLYGRLPRLLGTRAALDVFAEYREEHDEEINFGSEALQLELRVALPLAPRLEGRVYGRYRDSSAFDLVPDPVFPSPPLSLRWPSFGMQLVWDARDDPVSTRRGTFASADVVGADESLGSELSYVRLFTRASHHRPFGSLQGQPLLWAQSARLGLARSFRDQTLDRDERFFAGGQYSLRGYDEDSLGTRFLAVGEQATFVVNQELRVPVWRDLLTGVVFLDAGQVWNDVGDFGRDFLTSGGLGLRARTPVGTVRLDLAHPFDRRPGDDSLKLYLGLGNAF